MLLTLKGAIETVKTHIPKGQTLRESYAEAQGKYLFVAENSQGMIPPGGGFFTVNKVSGECKWEYPEREFLAPYAPIKGYKKLYLEEDA